MTPAAVLRPPAGAAYPPVAEWLAAEVTAPGSLPELVRSFVLPLRAALRHGGAPALLRLDEPPAPGAPLGVHLHVEAGARAWAGERLRHAAAAAGAVLAPLPPAAPLPGEPPLAGDEELAARCAVCLAHAAEHYLAAVEAAPAGPLPHPARLGAVRALLGSGTAAALPAGGARRYHAYHRDWLVRYPVLKNGFGMAKAGEVFALLDAQLHRAGAAAADTRGAPGGAWAAALGELGGYLAAREGDPALRVDPFADGPLFPVLLRLFHATARLFGLGLLDEAFLHHLLAGGAREGASFCLAPHLHLLPEPGAPSPGAAPTALEEDYPWREMVAAASGEGRAWLASYHESEAVVGQAMHRALGLLRRGELDESTRLLAQVAAHREEIREVRPAVFHVLGRFYHGEHAYYEYLTGNTAAAEREMDAAADSVRRAIGTHRFLLPLAPLVVDIPLQKARIARRGRRWGEMEAHLHAMYQMEAGARPLCVLDDGTEVDYALLGRYFASLVLPPERRAAAEKMLDATARLRSLRALTTRLYAPPELVSLRPPLFG